MGIKEYNSSINTQPIPTKEPKKMSKGMENGLIVMFIGILLIVAGLSFSNKDNEEKPTNIIEVESFSGVFKNSGTEMKLYLKSDNEMYYIINGNANIESSAAIKGKKANSEVGNNKYEFIIINGELNLNTDNKVIPSGRYEKIAEYSKEDFIKDNIGDTKYFDSSCNGLYTLGDTQLYIFQSGEEEISMILTSSNSKTYIEKKFNLLLDNLYQEDQQKKSKSTSKLSILENQVEYEVKTEGEDQSETSHNGIYNKEKIITIEDVINIKVRGTN